MRLPDVTYAQTLAAGGVNINDYISNGNNRSAYKNEWQPRLGFSYDLNGDEEHVILRRYRTFLRSRPVRLSAAGTDQVCTGGRLVLFQHRDPALQRQSMHRMGSQVSERCQFAILDPGYDCRPGSRHDHQQSEGAVFGSAQHRHAQQGWRLEYECDGRSHREQRRHRVYARQSLSERRVLDERRSTLGRWRSRFWQSDHR